MRAHSRFVGSVACAVIAVAMAACESGGSGHGGADTAGIRDVSAAPGVFADAGPALRFDPASCEEAPSSAVLWISGLDDGALALEGQAVVREAGAFETVEDAVASLSFAGPAVELAPRQTYGALSFWDAMAGDFGAVAWVDTRTAELVFAGSVVWAGQGYAITTPADATVQVGGDPADPPAYTLVTNTHWTNATILPDLARLGLRTEVVARYAACGEPTIAVYVYTPRVGITDPTAARGLVLVAGHRATTHL